MNIILRNVSCKFIQDTEYICAINSNNNDIYIIFLNYNIFDSKPTLTPINFIYFDDQCRSQVAHPNPNAPYKSVNSGHEESFSHRLLQINNPRPFSSLSGNNVNEKPQDISDPKFPAELKLNTIILFDTNDSLIKILCIRKNNVECRFFRIEIGSTNLRSFDLMETDIFTFESNYLKESQCGFLVFNSE